MSSGGLPRLYPVGTILTIGVLCAVVTLRTVNLDTLIHKNRQHIIWSQAIEHAIEQVFAEFSQQER